MAGPIERARRVLPQVNAPRSLHAEDLYAGSTLVLFGLYKKVFIADNLATTVDTAFSHTATLTRAWYVTALDQFVGARVRFDARSGALP